MIGMFALAAARLLDVLQVYLRALATLVGQLLVLGIFV